MTEKEYLNKLTNSQEDVLQNFLDLFDELKIHYCLVGGLAVNAYVEPVVSLDLDIVVAAEKLDGLIDGAETLFKIEEFPHSLNLTSSKSDLRIQLQKDPRYQSFLGRSVIKKVMGYEMHVATLEDVLIGKIWAYKYKNRRQSKRQKDLADIYRLVETFPHLNEMLPGSIKQKDP